MPERELNKLTDEQIEDIASGKINPSTLWWDEATRVDMMADRHLENAINKLKGLGKSTYIGDSDTKKNWIYVPELEQDKRKKDRLATKVDSSVEKKDE